LKKLIIKGMDKRYFSKKVVKWYKENHRNLPWRNTREPYRIWLSEIILQQTRVSQGLPYYERFIDKYPTVADLANAPEQEVLRLWQGLGYYSRARNLHKCAKSITSGHGGIFPTSFLELRKLPGIGDYTAAAIASIAHQEPVAVVDGNVFRVLARIFGIATPINSTEGKRQFTLLANELIDKKAPDIHNQAMMEFGALFCTPKNPLCLECDFRTTCEAYRGNLQYVLPVKSKSKKSEQRYFNYLVIQNGRTLAMKKREGKDIWHGLYDFVLEEGDGPFTESSNGVSSLEKLAGKKKYRVSKTYKHVLSHQTIYARFILVEASPKLKLPGQVRFYSTSQIAELPKPVLISRFLEDNGLS
jgi:A/G-specific adenine glycosylase